MVGRLKAHDAGEAAPKPGERMPPFAMPDDKGQLVTLDDLLKEGPLAMNFHRGHWCPYSGSIREPWPKPRPRSPQRAAGSRRSCRSGKNSRRPSKPRERCIPILTDIDNGYALSLNLAIWVGEEMQQILESGGRKVPDYQGNQAWVMPIPATFVIAQDGRITARFIDPDYRKRMTIEDLLTALKSAQMRRAIDPKSS